ncbi:hypothetical protein KH5_19580 [Urechidicola sp. KH5]
MKKVGIIIPDGTGIRNYLFSDLIKGLKKHGNIVLFHAVSSEAIKEITTVQNESFECVEIPSFRETLKQRFIRELICLSRLVHNAKLVNNKSIKTNWRPSKSKLKTKLFYGLIEFCAPYFSKSYTRILKLEDKLVVLMQSNNEEYLNLLQDVKPDILFSTHQRALTALPLLEAAHKLNIDTIGAIFSWDNLPKARLTLRTNKYIVWSEYMKNEVNTFYPEIEEENIVITGTPQFEFYYKNELFSSKDEFCSQFNLDPNKKILCFSGDDVRTSPFDPQYLMDVAQVIHENNLPIQILLRRAPVDFSRRYETIVEKYVNIIKVAEPLWHAISTDVSKWQTIFPTYKDVKLLVNTVRYSDAVINLGSTMAHDFAVYNKPAIYFNYNPVKNDKWKVEKIYEYQHFRSMGNLKPVIWLNRKEDIKNTLIQVMQGDVYLDNTDWLNLIAENRQKASENISNFISKCI